MASKYISKILSDFFSNKSNPTHTKMGPLFTILMNTETCNENTSLIKKKKEKKDEISI